MQRDIVRESVEKLDGRRRALHQRLRALWAAHGQRIGWQLFRCPGLVVLLVLTLAIIWAAQGASPGARTEDAQAHGTDTSALTTGNRVDEPNAHTVACLGVVMDIRGQTHGFFQFSGKELDETLANVGKTQIVQEGYTIRHRNCYDSWQAAADFMMDGEVIMPKEVTPESFMNAYYKWNASKSQR